MHGLVNRAIEGFVRQTHGPDRWRAIAAAAGLPAGGLPPFHPCPPGLAQHLARTAAHVLDQPEAEVVEDVGAWLVGREWVRRMLRLPGSGFQDVLFSLEDLPGRARMVLPDLVIPDITVRPRGARDCRVTLAPDDWLWRALLAGMLRAMADECGALVLVVDAGSSVMVDVVQAGPGRGCAGGWR